MPEEQGFTSPPASLRTRLILLVTGGACLIVGLVLVFVGPGFSPPVEPWYLISLIGGILAALGLVLMWKPMATKGHTSLPYIIAIGVVVVGPALYRRHIMLRQVEQMEHASQVRSKWSAIHNRAQFLSMEAMGAEMKGDTQKEAELYAKAAVEFRRALEYAEEHYGADSFMALICLTSLAEAEAGSGKPERAEFFFEWALATCQRTGDARALADVVKQYAKFLRDNGREEDARKVEKLVRPKAPKAKKEKPQ